MIHPFAEQTLLTCLLMYTPLPHVTFMAAEKAEAAHIHALLFCGMCHVLSVIFSIALVTLTLKKFLVPNLYTSSDLNSHGTVVESFIR